MPPTQAVHPSGAQIELAFGHQRAVVVELGGAPRAYEASGRQILDGYGIDELCSAARGQALIPWPNRIADGSYAFAGSTHQLPLNEPERRTAIHGLVRWTSWNVDEREPHRVALTHAITKRRAGRSERELAMTSELVHDGDAEPFREQPAWR